MAFPQLKDKPLLEEMGVEGTRIRKTQSKLFNGSCAGYKELGDKPFTEVNSNSAFLLVFSWLLNQICFTVIFKRTPLLRKKV